MKRTILFGGLALWALAVNAEARDWGFDKDTVYEWKPRGDSVWLVNNGADTLRLDSLFAEDVGTAKWMMVGFSFKPPPQPQHYTLYRGEMDARKMENNGIPAQSSHLLREFFMNIAVTAKTSSFYSVPEAGDTLVVKLRFKSITGEEDTLTVKSIYASTSIRSFSRPTYFRERLAQTRDLLGRMFMPSRKSPILNKSSE